MDPMKQTALNRLNVLLLIVIGAAGVGLLWREGYLPLVRWPFLLYGVAVFAAGFWFAAFELTTRRFLWLAVVAGGGGYLTQYVGATVEGAWTYPAPHHTYYFVPSMFVFAATLAYGLTGAVFGPVLRRRLAYLPRWPNIIIIMVLFAVLILTSGDHQPIFWTYYGALFLFALYSATMMNLATFLGLLFSALLVGGMSETIGAHSGLWTFAQTGWIPPPFLVLVSWPFEIILYYGASALLAGETLLARPRYFTEEPLYEPVPEHPMWTGEEPITVASIRHDDPLRALDEVLEVCDVFHLLEQRSAEVGKNRGDLAIAIKPNLMFMYSPEDRSTFTDPALVEHLIDRMIEQGYRNIAVVEAQSAYGNYFLDREVPNVAKVAGYRPEGRYRIVDLTVERVPHHFSGPLGDHFVGPTWRDADFRISFAKNKTHVWAWYTLCIKNIYGALALQDKIREYHYKREIYYPTIDMLCAFPVHFGLIDAYLSADGPFGIFADREPNATKTILGSANIVALDWMGAGKMGLDPMVSRYMQLAVQAFGRPHVRVVGDDAPYFPWENVPKPLIDFWDQAEESYGFTNTFFSILNRKYMSDVFRRRPMAAFWVFVSKLLAPLGGVVYKSPERQEHKN